MDQFAIKLLSELPEEVKKIDSKVILTESMCYYNYYSSGRVVLNHCKYLKKEIQSHGYIGMQNYDVKNEAFVIGLNEGNGTIALKYWKDPK